MGIIRAISSATSGTLADQWLEVIEADNMGETTVMTGGVGVHRDSKHNQNKKGTEYLITDKSVIMVGQNQFMLLIDGGKVIDYSAEAGYYTVNNSTSPSLFNGNFSETVKETFNRVKFGGIPSVSQKVYFINTQEIKNIAFGTTNPINYFDNFYNAELYLRAYGYFSIRITDPLKFYAEAVPRNASNVSIEDIHELYLSEFLNAFQTSINKMSADGMRISHVASKSMELAKYMSNVLDEDWKEHRGIIIESVGIANISYDEESKKLINIRNQGAMLSDPSVREGYVQGSIARGLEAAGSNEGGSIQGFMGVGMGIQSAGNFMASATSFNQNQMNQQKTENTHKASHDENTWTCSCGEQNLGQFCSKCGTKKPETKFCPECGEKLSENANFCTKCGKKL